MSSVSKINEILLTFSQLQGALVSFVIVCMPLLWSGHYGQDTVSLRTVTNGQQVIYSENLFCTDAYHVLLGVLIYTRKHWLHSRIFHKLHPLGIHDLVEELKSNDYNNNKNIYEVQRRYGRRKIIYIWSRGGVKSGKVWRRKWFLSWAWHMDKILIEILGEASVYSFAKWKW